MLYLLPIYVHIVIIIFPLYIESNITKIGCDALLRNMITMASKNRFLLSTAVC